MWIPQDLYACRNLEASLDLPHQGRFLDNAFVQVKEMLAGPAVKNGAVSWKFEIFLVAWCSV